MTHLMPSRYHALQETLLGLQQTGVPLVGIDGGRLAASGHTDDMGLYHVVPSLCQWLHLPLDQGLQVFFLTLFTVTLCLGGLGIALMAESWRERVLGWAGMLLLGGLALKVGDVYLVQWVAIFSVIPLFWGLMANGYQRVLLFAAPLAGLWLGLANQLRSHAGTTVLIFLAVALLLSPAITLPRKAGIAGLCLLGLGLNHAYFKQLFDARDRYLSVHAAPYVPVSRSHPTWHSIYIGLGFLENPFGIRYDDQVAAAAVKSLDPDAAFCSPEYEAALKQETLRLVRQNPHFAVTTLSAKGGVIGMYLVLFGGWGIGRRWRRMAWNRYDPAFALSLLFAALPGLLVMPFHNYLLGFISLSGLYSLSAGAKT